LTCIKTWHTSDGLYAAPIRMENEFGRSQISLRFHRPGVSFSLSGNARRPRQNTCQRDHGIALRGVQATPYLPDVSVLDRRRV